MRLPMNLLFVSASLLTLQFAASGLASTAWAGQTRVARIVITADYDPGQATFDIYANDSRDLSSIVYTSPTLPAPVRLSYREIVHPSASPSGQPAALRAGQGGTILFWKKERPVVILIANENSFDNRNGGEIVLKYLHNGRKENDLKYKTIPMRIVREGETWKILTDDHSTQIRSICFHEKSFWGFTVGADRHEINRSCPKS